MKKRVICVVVAIVIAITIILLSIFAISWDIASRNKCIEYSDTWMSFAIMETTFEIGVANKIPNIEVVSRKNIYYGLWRIATKVECVFNSDETTIEFFVVQLTKGYHFSNVDFDALVELRDDIVGRDTYICVPSRNAEEMEMLLSAMSLYL